jgi:hypothetical protein
MQVASGSFRLDHNNPEDKDAISSEGSQQLAADRDYRSVQIGPNLFSQSEIDCLFRSVSSLLTFIIGITFTNNVSDGVSEIDYCSQGIRTRLSVPSRSS